MEKTVNERVILLITQLNLGKNEFAQKAKLAPGTIWNIENGGNLSPKTVQSIVDGFNLNKEWLLSGKGKMFADEPKAESKSFDPARDTLYNEMKSQVSFYREQIGFLNELIKQLTGGKPLKSFPLTFNIPTTKVGLNVRA
jgi:transcriptional regulator with XRE-family HTH domain